MAVQRRPALGNNAMAGRIAFRTWSSRAVRGLEVVDTNQHIHRYPPHLHDALEVIWVRAGAVEIFCRDCAFQLAAGEACLVAPNELHGGQTTAGASFRFTAVMIPREVLAGSLRALGPIVDARGRPLPCALLRRNRADTALERLVAAVRARIPHAQQVRALLRILDELHDAAEPISAPSPERAYLHPAVRQVKTILSAECARNVQLARLARAVHLDSRYLISLFKAATGMPPHRFQIALRVDLARRLIQHDTPIRLAAALAGFADQSHLTRHFKRHYGMTPGFFRLARQPPAGPARG